jgi:glucose-1-phosphate cytidylyltransferase
MNIPAVILCGGMGTRLREETEFRPKPLVEVGGKPILWHIMKIFSHHGIREFVLCLGYKGAMIREYFLNYRLMNNDFTLRLGSPDHPHVYDSDLPEDWSITFADTGLEAMTGARVKRIQRYVNQDYFMLTYGDGVSDINLAKLWEFHRQHGKIATVTGVQPTSRYGELTVEGCQVQAFNEKPRSRDGLISGGFFVFHRRFFDYLNDDNGCILEREPLERLCREGQLMSYLHTGYWHCMDTYRDFVALNEQWKRNPPWKVWNG